MGKKLTIKDKARANLLKKYQYKWVALNAEENVVITSGNSMFEVDKKLQKNKLKAAVISYVFPFNASYSPYGKTKV